MPDESLSSSNGASNDAMGYKSELPKSLSMMSILGLSFAIMAVPFGLSTTFAYSLTDGQSVTVLWGWVFVSLISICIAASLGEICAVYPTSGGVYYWSAMLSTKEYAPVVSWITGWLGLVGNITVTLSINFSGALLILSAISLWNADFVATPYQIVLTFWAVMLIAFIVNAFGVKYNYLDQLNKICIYWTGASVLIIMITILVMSPTHRSADFVFAHFDASTSGWPSGWAWFVGLLQAAYTLTGYGMVASMCDEVQNPQREVPRAMVLSVVAAGLTGLLYLIPILFILPPIPTLLAVANGQPIGLIFATATGSAAGGFGLLFLLLGILFFAGVGSLTASSRNLYAFARDDAVPFSSTMSYISPSLSIPLNSLTTSSVIISLLGLIYFGSSAAFNAFTGCATICLSTSYGIPILVSLLRKRKAVRHSSFSLGKFGPIINLATLLWIALAIILFCMPTSIPVTPTSMNYASVVFAFFAAASVVWYLVSGRKVFKGPPVSVDVKREDMGVVLEDKEVPEIMRTNEGGSASASDASAKTKKAEV